VHTQCDVKKTEGPSKNMQSNWCTFNPGSFPAYTERLTPAPNC